MKKCVDCNIDIENRFKRCSECKKKHNKETDRIKNKKDLVCDWCGNNYFGTDNTKTNKTGKKFCSKSCGGKYYHSNDIEKELGECVICGNEFKKEHSNQFACSKKCSKIYYSNKKKEQIFNHKCFNCKKDYSSNSTNNEDRSFCSKKCEFETKRKEHTKTLICQECGKQFDVLSGDNFKTCSLICKTKMQIKMSFGKNNSNYKDNLKRTFVCKSCKKEFPVKSPHQNRKQIFCSRKCAKKMMKTSLTISHQKICDLLDSLKIDFHIEYEIKNYSVDIFIDDDLIIEVMGGYWHSDPRVYTKEKLNKIQLQGLIKDEKRSLCFKNEKLNTFYFWEKDILFNIDLCKVLILEILQNPKKNRNNCSFNYSLENKKLKINNIVIKPYQKI